MENKRIPYIYITNEKTMKKEVLSTGCLYCGVVDKEEDANKFNFNNAVACPVCGTIYIPDNNLRLIKRVLNGGNPFSYYKTDGPMQDDLGTNNAFSCEQSPKIRVRKPKDDANKIQSAR